MEHRTHTSMAGCEEFGPMLEDVATIMRLSLFGERDAMEIVLEGEDEKTLQLLTSAMSSSKTWGNCTYTEIKCCGNWGATKLLLWFRET